MPHPLNDACPCHSGQRYKRCCRPLHQGVPAATPTDLMRSRYAAYALGLADYIVRTTDPLGSAWEPDVAAWTTSVRAFSERTAFEALEIVAASSTGDRGTVSFRAHLRTAEGPATLAERSTFHRIAGRWLYHEGVQG